MRALELFAGIGGFGVVAREVGIGVVAAFDQAADACATYEANLGLRPDCRTLDSIDLNALPLADLWWMSPPCTPFTRRGRQAGAADCRARALLRLVDEIGRTGTPHRPQWILLENVDGFRGSDVHRYLVTRWRSAGYAVQDVALCPTRFGIPMKRPRMFLVAGLEGPVDLPEAPPSPRRPLAGFLNPAADQDPELRVPDALAERYQPVLNVVDPADPAATAICFTSGYGRALKAGGSFLRLVDGGLRAFSPAEILTLLGFPAGSGFPQTMSLRRRWHLAGNSLSLHCVRWLVQSTLSPRLPSQDQGPA